MLIIWLLRSYANNRCPTRAAHAGDLVRIAGQREGSILWQMDDRSAGVGEGQDGRDTQSLSHWRPESVWFLRVLNRAALPKHDAGELTRAACGDERTQDDAEERSHDSGIKQQKAGLLGQYPTAIENTKKERVFCFLGFFYESRPVKEICIFMINVLCRESPPPPLETLGVIIVISEQVSFPQHHSIKHIITKGHDRKWDTGQGSRSIPS